MNLTLQQMAENFLTTLAITQHVSLKCPYTSTRLHDALSQKTAIPNFYISSTMTWPCPVPQYEPVFNGSGDETLCTDIRHSSLSTGWMTRDLFLADRALFLFTMSRTARGARPVSYAMGTKGKAAGAWSLASSSAKVKNAWNFTPRSLYMPSWYGAWAKKELALPV
jgi:hypothetical protein